MEADINQMFTEHDIVPVLIDRAPLVFAKVAYRSKKLVDAGKELTPTEVRFEPKVEWCADPRVLYTLIMIDPDSPSRTEPSNREFVHWLVGNIPGKHVEQGEILVEYLATFPRSGTGYHRYIFLLYQQQCRNDYSEVPRVSGKNRTPRLRFSVREFAYRYSLGHPIAGNFFVAQFDEYVPVIISQFPASSEY
ncbi:protein D3-like [Toxorhynchites rutilus septentrionalis]|uniref:protein D3-like n=1 Tax=Toxorhynchites rutilus septentrionalis TaxID=329112 RepID=UPI00247A178B|nr:protein D3-like [Toxorhynchites rutilus septentrionalis]